MSGSPVPARHISFSRRCRATHPWRGAVNFPRVQERERFMMLTSKGGLRAAVVVAAIVASGGATALHAQGWHYPAFQLPEVAQREFLGAVSGGGDYGTSIIGQWRQPVGTGNQLSLEAGINSPSGGSTGFILGGALGFPLLRATAETPIDLMLTGGLYGAFSNDGSVIRIPLGAVVGHRIPLTGSTMAVTPFAHPRLSIDVCSSQCQGVGTTTVVNFDAGADLEFTPQLSLRGALTFGPVTEGPSQVGFGIGLAYRPATLGGGIRRP